MLEFIVTGQVPGTGFVVTFSWVIAGAVVIAGVAMLRREHSQHDHTNKQVEIEELAI